MIMRFYFSNIHDEYIKYLEYAMLYSLEVKKMEVDKDKAKEYYAKYTNITNLLVEESNKLN